MRGIKRIPLALMADLFLVIGILAHLSRWCIYVGKHWKSIFRAFASKTISRRIALRLSPAVLLIISFIAYGYFVPTSPVFGKVYYKAQSPGKVAALTFDDGPNEPYTSEILDILASHNVEATFFAIGKNVELYPQTTKRIVAEGHVIGNHSYCHNANHALTGSGSNDLKLAQVAIFNTVGVLPHLYRPPHGKKTPWELQNVKKEGLIEVTWSVSANELTAKSAVSVAEQIVSKTDPGEIILLHDGYGTLHNSSEADKSLTVQVLPLIIEQLQAKGYKFVTIPELLNVPAYQ